MPLCVFADAVGRNHRLTRLSFPRSHFDYYMDLWSCGVRGESFYGWA
jgi:hypothetical protein